ncbi:MAG: LysR family transcriptional regulator [Myxococcales bacterium]|nr:LysR family transcriptional regulator [Myxococcales bacterium]
MLSIAFRYTKRDAEPSPKSVNLNQLRVFAAVAAEGSATRAARRLRISQPAVSKHLAELEDQLGLSLFDRLPRGMRLTLAGQALNRHAERIIATEAAAEAELAELRGLSSGRLSIGASTTIGSYMLPSLFGAFHRAHPGVALELEIANTRAIQAALLDGSLDLGLTEGFVASELLDVEEVAHDEMVAIAAPSHSAARLPQLSLRELCALPMIVRERGSGTRDVIEAALAHRGIELSPQMALGSTESVKHAVASGLGVAIVSRLTVELELDTRRLVELPVEDLEIRRALHLLQLRGKGLNPAAAAFLQLLRDPLGGREPGYAI